MSEFGFEGVGDDADLMLSCVAGILTGDPGPEKLLELNGSHVRDNFSTVENGARGAIDFLRTQLRVTSLKLLPYPAMLVPLSVFFAAPDGKEVVYSGETYATIKRWFWRTCFSARYGSQTRRTTITDIEQMTRLRNGESSSIDDLLVALTAPYYLVTTFRTGTAATKAFILLLANNEPKSLLSGKAIDLDKVLQRYNRSEFHHIYPKAFLRDGGVPDAAINSLANFCFLSAAENKSIGRKRPSVYQGDLAGGTAREATLSSAFLAEGDFHDDYESFAIARSERLSQLAATLTA